jgi:hypothetical protein
MRQKGRIESQLNSELPGRYENTTGPPAWAAENRPERAGQDSQQLVSTAGSGYTSSYLGQNINVRPYAIALYPFCAQVKSLKNRISSNYSTRNLAFSQKWKRAFCFNPILT